MTTDALVTGSTTRVVERIKYDLHSVFESQGAAPWSNTSIATWAATGRVDNKLGMVVAPDQLASEAKNAMDDCGTKLPQSAIESEALRAGIALLCQAD